MTDVLLTSIACRAVRLVMTSTGNVPDKSGLSDKKSMYKLESSPNSDGTLPWSALLERVNSNKELERSPISEGMLP